MLPRHFQWLVLALLPGISSALGLGALRVESRLNEPLSAQIDIVGATPDQLQALKASVGSPELFERFNAERPGFLASATIAVGTDAAGRPVLSIHSTDAFTEPLVELLVDIRAGQHHLVRDYALLLDPARVAAPGVFPGSPAVPDETSSLLVDFPPVAIPNIVPESLMVALASTPDAAKTHVRREHRRAPAPAAARPASVRRSQTIAARAPAMPGTDPAAMLSALNRLNGQVQFLERTLSETSRQLASANARIGDAEQRAADPVVVAGPTARPFRMPSSRVLLGALCVVVALVAGVLAYARRSARSRLASASNAVSTADPTIEAPVAATFAGDDGGYEVTVTPEPDDAGDTSEMPQVVEIDVDTVEEPALEHADEPDTVVMETLEPARASDATGTVLDYNLADLDGRAQHVEMPGALHDHAVVVERRKNIVDTLMAAIKRDPTRGDLRTKLLETLYTAAATNLRLFKEVVRDLARHPERLNRDEWEQVMAMGRQIAPEDALFSDRAADNDVADCA